jgi:hypothetical protein
VPCHLPEACNDKGEETRQGTIVNKGFPKNDIHILKEGTRNSNMRVKTGMSFSRRSFKNFL